MTRLRGHGTSRRDIHCRNCGATAPGKCCCDCGQSTALHTPSALEFLHEFISLYIAFDGKLWKTLVLLRRLARATHCVRAALSAWHCAGYRLDQAVGLTVLNDNP